MTGIKLLRMAARSRLSGIVAELDAVNRIATPRAITEKAEPIHNSQSSLSAGALPLKRARNRPARRTAHLLAMHETGLE
jgi:hypothetical protein